jgi:hypothetical protein
VVSEPSINLMAAHHRLSMHLLAYREAYRMHRILSAPSRIPGEQLGTPASVIEATETVSEAAEALAHAAEDVLARSAPKFVADHCKHCELPPRFLVSNTFGEHRVCDQHVLVAVIDTLPYQSSRVGVRRISSRDQVPTVGGTVAPAEVGDSWALELSEADLDARKRRMPIDWVDPAIEIRERWRQVREPKRQPGEPKRQPGAVVIQ